MDKPKLIVHKDPKSPASEAYRTLRTNIQFSSLDNPMKTIVITSAGPGEGKTTSVINLGTAMAQSGLKVLLIDGDLRKPQIHKTFEIFNGPGLTDVLVNGPDYREGVSSTYIAGLEILSAGTIPPNPSELLASDRMKQFLGEIRENYDFVLIDTSPAAVVTDASILSAMVDGTILVCASGKVSVEKARRAKELLEGVNANIVGAILNKLTTDQKDYFQYYYAYHGKEYKPKKGRKKLRTGSKFA
ncbi:MAG: CpsD/CapB family tyrosine-protein kinase [Clostridiales bacterium]|jgi:protein-tyrosine kinase|nr:CpsD/CapB family tyrosine-protein kinase [Clostridiales bacterium]